MFRTAARIALTGLCAPALVLTLAACGSSSHDEDLEKQLADAKATEAAQAAALKAGKGAPAPGGQEGQQSLAEFYGGGGDDNAEAADDGADQTDTDSGYVDADDAGPDSRAEPPRQPARSAPEPMPVGPPNPIPQ